MLQLGGNHAPALSPSQERRWLQQQVDPEAPGEHFGLAIQLDGPLDGLALDRAFAEVLERHAVLRSRFPEDRGIPSAVIDPMRAGASRMRRADVRGLGGAARKRELTALTADCVQQAFDLEKGPLWRATLVRRGELEHVLLFGAHALVADRRSLVVITHELQNLYAAFATGAPPPPPDRGPAFAWFAAAQRQRPRDAQDHYWESRLAGPLPVLELPGDRPRPRAPTHRGESWQFRLPAPLRVALASFSRQHGVPLQVTMLATFAVLLHRHTHQRDLLVGIGSGRPADGAQVVGPLSHTLAVRFEVEGQHRFCEFLRAVGRVHDEAFAHRDVPFEEPLERVSPDRPRAAAPVFRASFDLRDTPVEQRLGGVRFQARELDGARLDVDLALELRRTGEWLEGRLAYSTDLFDRPTIARMARRYEVLLEGIVGDASCAVGALPLLGSSERRRLLFDFQGPRVPVPAVPLHRRFEVHAAISPDGVALVAGGRELSYAEVDQRANQLAHRLRRHGVERNVRVGVSVERSAAMVIAVLGVLKAGGAWVPVDPSSPPERAAFLLEDSGASALLTDPHIADRFSTPLSSPTALIFVDDPDAPDEPRDVPPHVAMEPDDLAYVMYTPDSTGRPTGVQVEHRSAVNFIHAMGVEPGMSATDRMLAVTPLGFDASVLELFLPLSTGARVVVASRDEAADGRALIELIERHRPTVMHAAPATWRLLLAADWRGAPCLRILCSGAALSPELADRLCALGAAVWRLYGPTEGTVFSTVARLDPFDGGVPIGRPLANSSALVLDSRGGLVPIGVPGELYLGGAGVARGYQRRDALTTEKFVRIDASGARERMYRTGDMACWRSSGVLDHLGRFDDQMQLRSSRSEPNPQRRLT